MYKTIIIVRLRTKCFCLDNNSGWLRPCSRRKSCPIGIIQIKIISIIVSPWSSKTNATPPQPCKGFILQLTKIIITSRGSTSYRMEAYLRIFLLSILLSRCSLMKQVLRLFLSLGVKVEGSRHSMSPRSPPQSSRPQHHQTITYSLRQS